MDDYVAAAETEEEALEMLNEGIRRFQRYSMKLCKVQSNSALVRQAYPPEDKESAIKTLGPVEFNTAQPEKRNTALGLQWNLQQDTYSVKTELKVRPMTRRGLLGYIMSPYDPFGIVEPAMLSTKLLQREIIPPKSDDPHNFHDLGWDDLSLEQFGR